MPRVIQTPHNAGDLSAIQQSCDDFGLDLETFMTLRGQASEAKNLAYCPYSKFHVGAAILTADNTVITGVNVENASYPVGTCAERVAFGKAVSDGHRKFKAVAVATDITPPASPCGMCRQFIREFCDISIPIIMFDKDDNFVILTLEELLPLSFGPEQLLPLKSKTDQNTKGSSAKES